MNLQAIERSSPNMYNESALMNPMQVIDRSQQLEITDPLYAFALDELLCQQAHQHNVSFCHIWRHPNAFVLGQRDSHLPYANEAMEWLSSLGYEPIIRNSGGAAVPLDRGTVNISLIYPLSQLHSNHFHSDFEKMYTLIQSALQFTGKKVDKGEIQGAFCPGDYDLSIEGRKFCGIAQRRKIHAYSVQAFVIAGGSGKDRTQLVRQFYDRAALGAALGDYPKVTDESTASLEELTHLDDQAPETFIAAVKATLAPNGQYSDMIQMPEPALIQATALKLRQRYTLPTKSSI